MIPSKPTLPIMSCFLFNLKDGTMLITAASADGQIRTSLDYTGDMRDMSICIESKMLLDSLRMLPEQPLEISIQDNLNVCIRYEGGKFQLMGQETKTFPATKDNDPLGEIRTTCRQFLNGILKTQFCSADDDELRPIMNAVYIEVCDGSMNYVGSDGHRLSLLQQKMPSIPRISFALPKKISLILKAIVPNSDDEIVILPSGNSVDFSFKNYQVVGQLLEGRYPNYRSVIPEGNDKIVTIETSGLINAISRVAVFSNQTSHQIRFSMRNNALTLYGQDLDFSTNAEEKVECEYDGIDYDIAFDHVFLLEMLSIIPGDRCQMFISDPSRAVLIKPEDNDETEELTCLIMPLMIE
ncbi:MAG: DNA polymerase III subunit beta [Parabacteroides gordonii]|nr:DNA polymerase III subunit beta [Parabacteroides gordonii]